MQALEVLAILADRVHQNLSDRTSSNVEKWDSLKS